MSWVVLLLCLSVVAQLAAAVLAFRLSAVYGQRLAWNCISLALAIMLIRRGITLYGAATGTVWATFGGDEEGSISCAAAVSTLAASLLMLLGVALIGPVVRTYAHVEEVLRGEIDRLDQLVLVDQAEMRVAADIQRDMLPSEPPHFDGFDIAGGSYPAMTVGADYFDFIPLANEGLMIAVGDVSGHGVGPALLMAETRAYLRAIAADRVDLGELLTRINRFLCEDDTACRFVTLFLARLDPNEGTVQYASAGHPAYLLQASEEVVVLPATGLPMGLLEEKSVVCGASLVVQPDDLLLVVTDGISESRRADGEFFGVSRALASVRSQPNASAQAIVNGLFHDVLQFLASETQQDDMTVVVAKRVPSAGGDAAGSDADETP